MEPGLGSKYYLQNLKELTWDFFIWSRTLFPHEYLPYRDHSEPFDLVTHELSHARTHIVGLFERLLTGSYTHPRNAVQNNINDLVALEKVVSQTVSDVLLLNEYLSWLKYTHEFLKKIDDALIVVDKQPN